MRLLSNEEKISRHLDFWNGRPQKRPLTVVRTGDWFFSREFAPNRLFLEKGRELKPEEIRPEEFLADYDRMYETFSAIPSDALFAAEPCTGFPWMEGICGAGVLGAESSFISRPAFDSIEDLEGWRPVTAGNPWYDKYLEFCRVLRDHAAGRYAVAQPILRGVTDTVGALIGQEEMACAVLLEPELTREAFLAVMETQRSLIRDAEAIIPPFLGGYMFGFYHIWAPERVMWYQEDLAALLSPQNYADYLVETGARYIEGYPYNLTHLHPASFHHIDQVLKVPGLRLVQINRDVGGPSVRDMLPVFRKVLDSGKLLAVGMGRIVQDDIDALMDGLPRERVALNIISETPADALELLEYMETKSWS